MLRLATILTALLLTPVAAQAGIATSITKALPAVQSVGMAPDFKIVFTQPKPAEDSIPCTCDDPAEDWPGSGGGADDAPPGDDDIPTDGGDRP